ncbi:hypothetical protein A0U93_13140 [Neoasaia chiangmaiensis]|uniref:Uncharacterized protein n=1 Tax=Neoasaia chiangmaiensis TaxID=320497 RepID=A0A1U9KS40_9PROT|nr:hypothetical protein A0U93_13140 [Neoasaia chiangmaiensis]
MKPGLPHAFEFPGVAVNRDIGLSVTGHDADLLNRTGETSTSALAGAAIHADYALAERLVLRSRAGWAEVLNAHHYFSGLRMRRADSRTASGQR